MIDLDIGKLILLALIALVVLGPEKLPVAARTAGAIMRRMRNGWNSVRTEVERELQIAEIRKAARDTSERMASTQATLGAALRPLRDPLDIQALNTLMHSPKPASNVPPDSSAQISLTKASATVPSSEPLGRGNSTKEVLDDVA